MTAAICPHGDIAAACLDCLDAPPPERPARTITKVGAPFPAHYPATCAGCDQPIDEDDPIQRFDVTSAGGPERSVYTHEDCTP